MPLGALGGLRRGLARPSLTRALCPQSPCTGRHGYGTTEQVACQPQTPEAGRPPRETRSASNAGRRGPAASPLGTPGGGEGVDNETARREFERRLLGRVLHDCDGNRSETARRLHTKRTRLNYRLGHLGLERGGRGRCLPPL